MKKAIFGLATSEEHAQRIVNALLASGFSREDISILSSDRTKAGTNKCCDGTNARCDDLGRESHLQRGNLTTEKHTKAPEGGVTGTVVGGLLCGSVGLLAGLGALAIPGLGPFIAAGPLMATLSGTAIGGSLGLIIGALIGAGIPEYEAVRYESKVKAGEILISVHADDDEEINRAHEILKREGAKDISTSREKAGSSY